VVCVGSSHNNYFQKKVNKHVHKKLEFSTRVGTMVGRKKVLKQAEVVHDIKS